MVDLRTNGEKTELPDPEIEGVEFIHNPLLSDAMLGITREGQEQADSLSAMILELLKEAENHPKENMEKTLSGSCLRRFFRHRTEAFL